MLAPRVAKDRVLRVNLLLKSDADGPKWPDSRIAEALDVSVDTVARRRYRCVFEGLAAATSRRPPSAAGTGWANEWPFGPEDESPQGDHQFTTAPGGDFENRDGQSLRQSLSDNRHECRPAATRELPRFGVQHASK